MEPSDQVPLPQLTLPRRVIGIVRKLDQNKHASYQLNKEKMVLAESAVVTPEKLLLEIMVLTLMIVLGAVLESKYFRMLHMKKVDR